MNNTVVLVISADLPFAMSRFCSAEGLNNVVTLSTFRDHGFHGKYGVDIADGPLKGLTARAVVVLDENNKVAALGAGAGDRQRAKLRCGAGRAQVETALTDLGCPDALAVALHADKSYPQLHLRIALDRAACAAVQH